MRRLVILSISLLGFGFAAPALADDVRYVIPTAGVSCRGTAAQAEQVVKKAVPVRSVEADPMEHTVTATFDDDTVALAAVLDSLRAAGYEPGEPQLITQ